MGSEVRPLFDDLRVKKLIVTYGKSNEIPHKVTALEAQLARKFLTIALEAQLADDWNHNYTMSGSFDLDDVPEDVTDSELEIIVQQIIADAFGIHSRHVEVAVNPTTGDVTYCRFFQK